MSSRKKLKPNRLAFALVSAMAASIAAPGVAQDVAADAEQADTVQPAVPEAESTPTQLNTIAVPGSRISRDVFNAVSPVQVGTREETTLAGFDSTTAALQSNTVTAGSSQINNAYGGYVTNGGPGANTRSEEHT